VIGSDSSVTFSTGGSSTIEQRGKKIEIIDNCLIIAGTGSMGLGQRFCHQVGELQRGNKIPGANAPTEIAKCMAQAAITDFQSTGVKQGQYGALAAFRSRKEIHLCEFGAADFQPELKTADLWYASMGSGQLIADPFLGFIRKVFWRDGMPSLADGVFAAVWTLSHTIDMNAGGVNGPIHIATLTFADAERIKAVTTVLDSDQIEEHLQSVSAAEKHLGRFREMIDGTPDADTPVVPVPPAAEAAISAVNGIAG